MLKLCNHVLFIIKIMQNGKRSKKKMRKKKGLCSLVAYLRFKKKKPRIIMSVDKERIVVCFRIMHSFQLLQVF